MKEQFIPYELTLKLKELGFDEECLAYSYKHTIDPNSDLKLYLAKTPVKNSQLVDVKAIAIPLWQQAFDWFREKHGLFVKIDFFQSDEFPGIDFDYCIIDLKNPFKEDGVTDNPVIDYSINETYYFKYEEVRLASLEKLIELSERINNQ